jgi:hypothetical protein
MLFDDILRSVLEKLKEPPEPPAEPTQPMSEEEREIAEEALRVEANTSRTEADRFLNEIAETAAKFPDWVKLNRLRLARDLRRADENFEHCISAVFSLNEAERLRRKREAPPTECGTS